MPGQREPRRQMSITADGDRAAGHGQRFGARVALGRRLHGRRGPHLSAARRHRGRGDHTGPVDGRVPSRREQGARRHEASALDCGQREPGQHERGQHRDLCDEQLLWHWPRSGRVP